MKRMLILLLLAGAAGGLGVSLVAHAGGWAGFTVSSWVYLGLYVLVMIEFVPMLVIFASVESQLVRSYFHPVNLLRDYLRSWRFIFRAAPWRVIVLPMALGIYALALFLVLRVVLGIPLVSVQPLVAPRQAVLTFSPGVTRYFLIFSSACLAAVFALALAMFFSAWRVPSGSLTRLRCSAGHLNELSRSRCETCDASLDPSTAAP